MKLLAFNLILTSLMLISSPHAWARNQWNADQAQAWYRSAKVSVGANFLPANSINQLEMWQSESFDERRIDLELGWAENLGMTSMRVFLHDLLWQKDAKEFQKRIDRFLSIASRHHIKPLFVLFDSCWDPKPTLGIQHAPVPGVHNSGWVQSPGLAALNDRSQWPRLETYVRGVIKAFGHDSRVLAWDLWNEPDNLNSSSYHDPESKWTAVEKLLPQVFSWARSEDPAQPLTSGVWSGDYSVDEKLTSIQRIQLENSEIISFHCYAGPEGLKAALSSLSRFKKPIFLTEYMARPLGSRIENVLPLTQAANVSAYNWGFVAGKSQTYIPWDSWQHPYSTEPAEWFHDLLHGDGTPYRKSETDFLKQILGSTRQTTLQ